MRGNRLIKQLLASGMVLAVLVAEPGGCAKKSADPQPSRSQEVVNPPALNVPPGMGYTDAGVGLHFFGEIIPPSRTETAAGKSISVTGKVIYVDPNGVHVTVEADPGEGCRKTEDHKMICTSPTKQVVVVPPQTIATVIFTFEFQTSQPGWKMHCYGSFDPQGRSLRFDEETSDPTSARDPVADATCSWP